MTKLYHSLLGNFTQSLIGKLTLILIFVLATIVQTNAQGTAPNPIEVSNLSFSPSVIDTTNDAQTVAVSIRVTDSITNVKSIAVGFRSLTGSQLVTAVMTPQQLTSGDNRDGFYQGYATFPQDSKSGKWSVFEIVVFDSVTYRNFYSSDLAARNFPVDLEVISLNEDVAPPDLTDFKLDNSFVDISSNSRIVTVTLRMSDAQAGVRSVDVNFSRPDDDYLYPVSMHLVSGDAKDGIYQGAITFPQNTEPETYNAYVSAYDLLGNSRHLSGESLSTLGFVSTIQIGGASSSQPSNRLNKRTRVF